MIITEITDEVVSNTPLYYSRWHSCSNEKLGSHYDIAVGGLVGSKLSFGKDTFIICTYLIDL